MKKKQLVYKSKHGDIPFLIRDWMPKNEVWFGNGEAPIDIFDQDTVTKSIQEGLLKKVRFITKFKKRRIGKITNIL